jgi:hypothetical protein
VTRFLLACVAVLLAASPACAQPLSEAYRIFDRARTYWLRQRYPPLVEYRVAITVLEGGKVKTERYWSAYDSVSGQVVVDPVSDYERAHPVHAARGIGISIPLLSSFIGKPQPPADELGVPELAPNYTFGMARIPPTAPERSPDPMELVREIRAEFHDPFPPWYHTPAPSPQPSTPPVIERAFVYDRPYRITLVGTESIDGVTAYHLRLRALRDPGYYRLRDVWVDTRTFAPVQLIEALNFVTGPGTSVPWRVRFTTIGGALYIAEETALEPMRYDGLVYERASVSFEDLHAVDRLSRMKPLFSPQAPLILREPGSP